MELRQLHFFVSLADELHFGRAAKREHIAQSALSLHIRRLEKELGVALFERTAHYVRLTAEGEGFLAEVKRILGEIDSAVGSVATPTGHTQQLRVATVDSDLTLVPLILKAFRRAEPDTVIHQIEVGLPEQLRLLREGRLDASIGPPPDTTCDIASEVVCLDPIGVLVPQKHAFSTQRSVPVTALAGEPIVFFDESHAPEHNQLVREMCRLAGFTPLRYRMTVQSVCAAAQLVTEETCICVISRSMIPRWPGSAWITLENVIAPVHPWSLIWKVDSDSASVPALLDCARGLSRSLGWRAAGPVGAVPADEG